LHDKLTPQLRADLNKMLEVGLFVRTNPTNPTIDRFV
jgi:hypothetical protein